MNNPSLLQFHYWNQPWPLVLVIEDCFVPQSAQLIVETISEQSDETCGLLFALAGMKASGEWSVN